MPITLNSNAICTLETAQIYLANTSDAADDLYSLGINVISSMFDQYCGYQLISQTYTDYKLNGTGDWRLWLPALNVTALTAVKYRQSYTTYAELEATLYELDTQSKMCILGLEGYKWAMGERNYSATFIAGWTQAAMPGAIIRALFNELQKFVEGRGDVQSRNMGGQSNSGQSYINLDEKTVMELAPYKLLVI